MAWSGWDTRNSAVGARLARAESAKLTRASVAREAERVPRTRTAARGPPSRGAWIRAGARARGLLHAVHQALDQRRDEEQQHAGAQQRPEAEGVAGMRGLDGHAALAADPRSKDARQVVADRDRQEPAAHRQAGEPGRRK